MSTATARISQLAAEIAPEAVALRRDIHRNPELGWNEHATTARVAAALARHGIEATIRETGTGLYADFGAGEPFIGFRADLDALPLHEASGVEFASSIPGLMHACGHDAHTAVATGIAIALNQIELPGRVRVVFQPAEEMIPGGAMTLLEEGVIDGIKAMIAFHVDPSLPPGNVGLRIGPITGASDRLIVRLAGPGGHTSRPHQTVDLLYAAARVITDFPALLRHEVDPRQAAVAVFGRINGGSAANIIPAVVEMAGTLRLFDTDLWLEMPQLAEKLVKAIVAPLGAVATVDYTNGAPPVVNDVQVIEAVRRATHDILGEDSTADAYQSLGSEDFSWLLADRPGALIRLGAGKVDAKTDLHSASFDLDETAIETGIAVGIASLLELFESLGEL